MTNKPKTRYAAALAISSLMLAGCFGSSAEQYLAAAKEDLAKQDNAAAIIQLKNALQKNPSLGEARFLLGKALLQTGDARSAAIEFGKAKELGFADANLIPVWAQALLSQGQYEKVLSEFGNSKLDSPAAMAELQASLASAYNASGKPAKAMETIDAALLADSSNLRAQLIRVNLIAETTSAELGLTELDKVLTKSPQSSEAWQIKGELLNFGGKSAEAIAAFEKALQLKKDNTAARIGLFNVKLALKDADGAKAQLDALRGSKVGAPQVAMMSAMLALERNDLPVARENMQALLKYAPDDPRVLHLAGIIEFRRGALIEAADHLSKAIQTVPSNDKARVLLAQTELRSGDPAKALSVLQPMLGEGGASSEAFSVAAEAYLQLGDSKHAEEAFTRASKLNPNDVSIRAALALAQIGKGKVDDGIALLRALSSSDSGTVADLALISTYMQKKDWDHALKAADVLESKTPNRASTRNIVGRIELMRGDRDKARDGFNAALKLDPAYFPATASLAGLDLEAKQPQVALERFQKALSANPRSVPANMAVIGLREQMGASKDDLVGQLEKLIKQAPTEARPRYALIELLIRNHQTKLALAASQDAVATLPDSPNAWLLLARAQSISGDFNQAISSYNKVIGLMPNSPEPLMLLSQAYAARGDKTSSNQYMRRALKLMPGYLPAQRALISNELAAGNVAEARRLADAMKATYPNEPLVYSIVGDVKAVQGDWAGAALNYRATLKLLPNVDVAIKLHRVLVGSGKSGEAQQFESDWLAAHPQDLKFLVYSADINLLLSKYDLALRRYLEVLKLQPGNASAANNVAWLLNRSKDPKAIEYAESAIKLAPENPGYLDTMAQIYADQGHFDKAIEIQKKSLALGPEMIAHRFHLAQFYVGAGQKAQAREQLQQLSLLGDKFPQQADVRKLLESL